jgi:glucose/arabinose dehydrogenase
MFALGITLVSPANAVERQTNFSTKIVETNFQNFEIRKYEFQEIRTPLVIATSQTRIFVAGRNSNEFRILKINGESLVEVKKVILPMLPIETETSKQFILDLKYFKNKLFVSYMSYNSNINVCDRLVVIEFSVNDDNVHFSKSLFSSTPCISQPESPGWSDAAGRLETDGTYLYVSGGMILNDLYLNYYPHLRVKIIPTQPKTFFQAEKSTNIFGAIAKVNLKTLKAEKFATGLRGPQGLLWDSHRKILWETEHGPRGGDELNIIERSKNYGWPFVTLGRPYTERNLQGDNFFSTIYGEHSYFAPPVFSWTPSVGVSQLVLIPKNSNFNKNLQGNLLVSSLKDLSVYSLKVDSKSDGSFSRILYSERIYIGQRIRDMENYNGEIILSTDSGEIIFLDGISGDLNGTFPTVN